MDGGDLRRTDAGDDPRRADRARPHPDLDRVRPRVDERLGALACGDVAADDLDVLRRRVGLQPRDHLDEHPHVAVGGVGDEDVDTGIGEGRRPLPRVDEVADGGTDEQAAQEYLPYFVEQMHKLGAERGWPPMTEAQARQQLTPEGAVYCGSPETVARKIATTLRTLGAMAEDIIAALEIGRVSDERHGTLELVENMAGVGHWRLELATGRVHWSNEVFRIHGLDRATFDPQVDSAVDRYHPDDRPGLLAAIAHSTETGDGFERRLRLIRADGEERAVLTQARTERDDAGVVKILYGVFQDITDQQAQIARAQRDEARYRLLAENVGDVITRVRPDGTSKYISPAIESLLGYRGPSVVIHRDDLVLEDR